MAIKADAVVTKDGVTDRLNDVVRQSNGLSGFFKRDLFKMYQKAQMKRFMSEGSSEELPWKPVKSTYATYKKKRFASYPGSGSKTMVATDTLRTATIDKPFNMSTDKKFIISMNTSLTNPETKKPLNDYAREAVAERPVMRFSDDTIKQFKKEVMSFLTSRKR